MELSSKENLYEFASLIVKNLTFDIQTESRAKEENIFDPELNQL